MKVTVELKLEQEQIQASGLEGAALDAAVDKRLKQILTDALVNLTHVDASKAITGESIYKMELHLLSTEAHDEIIKALEVVKNVDTLSEAAKSFIVLALEKLKD